jgi:hypothetical protein
MTQQQYRGLLLALAMAMGLPLAAWAEDLPSEVMQKPYDWEDAEKALIEWFQRGRQGPPPPLPGPPTYSAEAIEAWVVDEDTGEPLEGVIVTANWELKGWHTDLPGQMRVMETVTDATGRFSFPAWGPKPRPPEGYLSYKDPQLLLFKSGYKYLGLANRLTVKINLSPLRCSDWHGQTIKLKKFEGSLEEYAKHLDFLDDYLEFAFRHDDCSWKHIPRMLVAMHLEKMRFKEKGVPNYFLSSLENRAHSANAAKCSSLLEFLRSYLP